jgi:CRP/FNR family cyclic AMP-dependent transcriptional regulator
MLTDEVQTDRPFLNSPGMPGAAVDYRPTETVYSQGDPSDAVLYIERGSVKLTVLARNGKEAVVGILTDGDFFGEEALSGRRARLATALAMTPSSIRVVPKQQMIRSLREQRALASCFIAHMLSRNNRLEADLIDQLFNDSEKRLARALLLLTRYGKPKGQRGLPKLSQAVLAEMVGTTRSRVNMFMNKFRKLGFIDYGSDGLRVHDTLNIVLGDSRASAH